MPRSRKMGLVLVVVAVVAWAGWTGWARTRKWCPVDVPLAIAQGAHTETDEFTVNVDGPYEISVEATGNNSVPLKQLVCMFGLEPSRPDKKCFAENVVRTSWILTSKGKEIAKGSSDSDKARGSTAEGWSEATLVIGTFSAKRGESFKLTIAMLGDASALSSNNPRLKVVLGGTLYEFVLVVTGLLNIGCGAIGILGAILLAFSFRKRRV